MDASVNNVQSLSTVFAQLLQVYGLKNRYLEARLRKLWPQLMGTAISAHTIHLYLTDKVLYLSISSSVLRWELSTQKDAIRKRLNEALGEESILRLVIK